MNVMTDVQGAMNILLKVLPEKRQEFLDAAPDKIEDAFVAYLATVISVRDFARELGRHDLFNVMCAEIETMTPKRRYAAVAGAL